MKRLVADGMPRVYQLARCFRNVEEQGPFHHREFTMLEWYASRRGLPRCAGAHGTVCWPRLRAELAASSDVGRQQTETGDAGDAGGGSRTPSGAGKAGAAAGTPVQHVTMAQLWRDERGLRSCARVGAGTRGTGATAGHPGHRVGHLGAALQPHLSDPRRAAYSRQHHAVAVLDYPARIPTLAATVGDGVHAQRWELYLGGVEVANCFQEETGPGALRELLKSEARRQRTARVVPRPDLALAEAFGSVAACSGVAVGIDRLYAILLGLPAIAPLMACADTG